MKFINKPLQPLTQQQREKLKEWETSYDACDRFQNNFYLLYKQQLFEEYYITLKQSKNIEDHQQAREVLYFGLDYLNKMYMDDLNLVLENQLLMAGVFVPWRVQVVPPVPLAPFLPDMDE